VARRVIGSLRVVTANLKNGGADPPAFARLVETLAADVVAVQEITPPQADALAAVLPFGTLEPMRNYMGMGIALRRPGAVCRVPLPHRSAFATEVEIEGSPGRPVEILNVHMAAPHRPPPWWTLPYRRRQLRALEAYLDGAPRPHRAIAGDLNSTPLWPLYRRLARRFRDAALEAAARDGGRTASTWGPWPGAPRLLRIDHVLVAGLDVRGVRVVPIAGSDHSALVVDLALPGGAAHRDD
jgi:endonuclease/exonuclease/phosphatase family metal-dependent hydrolase